MAKPKLRFPEFTEEWEEKRVSEIFEFTNGKAHEQNVDEDGKYIIVNSKFISTEGKIKKFTNDLICPLKKDDIVMVMSDVPNGRAMSKCFLIQEDDKYTLNQRICGLRTNQNSIFYIHQISRNKYYLKFDNGVSQTNLRKEDVINCPIFETTDNEQQKIADFLSKMDEKIANQEAVVSDYEEMKKGLMQKIFSQEVRFKTDNGSEYPEWEEKRLNQIASFLQGLTYAPENVMDNGTLVLRSSNIQENKITYEDNVYVNMIIPSSLKVKENDILMCVRNGSKRLVGKTALITKNDLGYTWGAFMMVIRSNEKNKFIYYYLNSSLFQKQIYKDSGTATINQITKGMLNACKLLIPCIEEQKKIADCLSAIDRKIEAEKKILEDWKELKKALLQQMFV